MNTLILTVGLPRSGKTTWAGQWFHPIVNPDSIRLALHGQPFIGSAEPFVWAIARCMVKSLFLSGHGTVILDATNTTRKRRDEWKSKDWVRHFKVFHTDPQLCKQRATEGASDLEHMQGLIGAIERMAENWEDVTSEEFGEAEGFCE